MANFQLRSKDKAQTIVDAIVENMQRRVSANPMGICPVDMALSYVELCHTQSCGKCVPCRIGLGQLASLMRRLLDNEADENTLDTLRETAEVIRESADCVIGTNAASIVLRGLDAYKDEYLSHARHHKCLANRETSVPCTSLCPAGVDVPGYITLIEHDRTADAVRLIRKDNPFATACAYVCTHPCENGCRRKMLDDAINIRGLKKYAVDAAGAVPPPACAPSTGKTVSVIGGGPGGVTAAYYLSLMGHKVRLYEKQEKLGGMLRYGIPSYRFPREKLDEELSSLLETGIEVHTGVNIGTDITFEELRTQSDCVFIAIGAQLDRKARIEGENAKGVISAVELLRGIGSGRTPDFTGKTVVVIGGGNVAMDATRSALRLGAEKVSCVYRRRRCDMTADAAEVEAALAEGAEMITLHAPERIEVNEDGSATALWAQPQIAGAIDAGGRPKPERAAQPARRIPADVIIMAIGQAVDSAPFEAAGVPAKRGCFLAGNDTAVQGVDGVFAGGDCVTGPETAIRAIAAGKAAAAAIDSYLGFNHKITSGLEPYGRFYIDKVEHGRVNLNEREAIERKADFQPVELGMTEEEAHTECLRCLHCDLFGCGNFEGGRIEQW